MVDKGLVATIPKHSAKKSENRGGNEYKLTIQWETDEIRKIRILLCTGFCDGVVFKEAVRGFIEKI